jgi:hypothetical protein
MDIFKPDSSMFTMNGVFYPSGYVLAMLKDANAVRQVNQELLGAGIEDKIFSLPPPVIKENILRGIQDGDNSMPSFGAESDMVRRIGDLSRQGCYGILIEKKSSSQDAILGALKNNGCLAAFYYRTLIIEDWIEPSLTPAPDTDKDGQQNPSNKTASNDAPAQSVVVGTRAASESTAH